MLETIKEKWTHTFIPQLLVHSVYIQWDKFRRWFWSWRCL